MNKSKHPGPWEPLWKGARRGVKRCWTWTILIRDQILYRTWPTAIGRIWLAWGIVALWGLGTKANFQWNIVDGHFLEFSKALNNSASCWMASWGNIRRHSVWNPSGPGALCFIFWAAFWISLTEACFETQDPQLSTKPDMPKCLKAMSQSHLQS